MTQETTTEESVLEFVLENKAPDMDEIAVHVGNGSDSVTISVYRDENGIVYVNVVDNTDGVEYRSVLGLVGSTTKL